MEGGRGKRRQGVNEEIMRVIGMARKECESHNYCRVVLYTGMTMIAFTT